MSREERQEERRRRFRSTFPFLVATGLGFAAVSTFYADLPWQLYWSLLVALSGVWIVGIWYVAGRPYTPQQVKRTR
jgi:hypothetical protein